MEKEPEMTGLLAAPAALSILALAAPAIVEERKPEAEIVKRGPDGRAEIVRIEGRDYPVCKDDQKDGCINPRDAGLDWGNREIDHWPGKPRGEAGKPDPAPTPTTPAKP